ncbi:hypothetical protein J2Y38_003369 [Flavobacterium sp. 2755]|uniref:hypothetical protein n=1 Tax=Flavobacterium sp. 2755 TaxID=2817765 RepID=UPI00285A2DBC|nr:hypothetical protein [Flavobacterium sp. 2755]MDR6763150.1 hypothetical protein [Flavobacterium sp. 2755]
MNIYKEIIELRDIDNAVDRGYKFEQIIREIQPWDRKPPVVASVPSEQLDGIFVWKNQAYLIESKAKVDQITPGSHDWEDFELKIRRRKNAVVGLFCSLYNVSENVYERAKELNREGHYVIVLAGDFWDEINNKQLAIEDLLDYMNLFGRVKFLSKPPSIESIKNWFYDQESTEKKILDISKKSSATFLRRHKSPFHESLYIRRDIDNLIESYSKDLKPSSLKKAKEQPKQICLLRDYSGSGKTTLSLELINNSLTFFGTGLTANESDIDEKISLFFSSLGQKSGLYELESLNKPIVFVIDSLDEANYDLQRKKKEVLSILKFIDELNIIAESTDFICFPVLFVFTIREDYWRDWESIFEGRRRIDVNKRISTFSSSELPKVVEKYSKSYNYNITNELSSETNKVLSSPINLLIFSETYKFQGDIVVNEIWEGNVIDTYFTRKKEDIHKRYIPGLTSNVLYQLISLLSFHVVKGKKNSILQNEVDLILRENFSMLIPYSDEIINALISELIIVRDPENLSYLRFRHSRFIEFLLAYYIVITIQKDNNLSKLDYYAQVSFESGIVLMFRIHDDIRYIGKTKFPNLISKIEDYYSQSNFFMTKKMLRLRSEIAVNSKTDKEDIALILKNINSNDSELITSAYFIIVAKSNNQSQLTVLNLFLAAFKNSTNYNERYKLIAKLDNHNLLVNEKVLDCIFLSEIPKEWEVYLGLIIEKNICDDFRELWKQSEGEIKLKKIISKIEVEDWRQVNKLIIGIMDNLDFIKGEFES